MSTPSKMNYEVISAIDIPSQDPNRVGKMDMVINYRIDPLHSFSIKIPAETATKTVVQAEIEKDLKKRAEIFTLKGSI